MPTSSPRCAVSMRTLAQAAATCLRLPGPPRPATLTITGTQLTLHAATSDGTRTIAVQLPAQRVSAPVAVELTADAVTSLATSKRTTVNTLTWCADTGIVTIGNLQLAARHTTRTAVRTGSNPQQFTVPAGQLGKLLAAGGHHLRPETTMQLHLHGGILHVDIANGFTALRSQLPVSTGVGSAMVTADPHTLRGAAHLLTAPVAEWVISTSSRRGRDYITISDGTTTITSSTTSQAETPPIPTLDSTESGQVWDADIPDPIVLLKFLDALPPHFTETRGYVQIRNPLGAGHGDEHELDIVARDGTNLAASGRKVGARHTDPVTSHSTDAIAVDIPLQPLRALIRSAVTLGGPLQLRGHRPYVSSSLIAAHTPHGTAIAVARTPQPL